MKLTQLGKLLQAKGFGVHFEHGPEDIAPEGQFTEEKEVQWVKEQIESGNEAAWFRAEVWLSWNGLESEKEYLGGCSYQSFDDFTGDDGYYIDDMLIACYNQMREDIQSFPIIDLKPASNDD